jgi:hypothetical protein
MFTLRLAARHQGLAHAPIDDIVWRRASRGPSLQCMAAVGLPRVELSARWLRSCRIVARQNTSAFLLKWGAWPAYGRAVALMAEFLPLGQALTPDRFVEDKKDAALATGRIFIRSS